MKRTLIIIIKAYYFSSTLESHLSFLGILKAYNSVMHSGDPFHFRIPLTYLMGISYKIDLLKQSEFPSSYLLIECYNRSDSHSSMISESIKKLYNLSALFFRSLKPYHLKYNSKKILNLHILTIQISFILHK